MPIDTARKKCCQYDSLKKFREGIIEKTKDVLVVSDKKSIGSYFRSRNDTVSEIIVNKEFDNEKEFIEEISEILVYLSKDITEKGYIRHEMLALEIFCSEQVVDRRTVSTPHSIALSTKRFQAVAGEHFAGSR